MWVFLYAMRCVDYTLCRAIYSQSPPSLLQAPVLHASSHEPSFAIAAQSMALPEASLPGAQHAPISLPDTLKKLHPPLFSCDA